jgi:hypothetical protein
MLVRRCIILLLLCVCVCVSRGGISSSVSRCDHNRTHRAVTSFQIVLGRKKRKNLLDVVIYYVTIWHSCTTVRWGGKSIGLGWPNSFVRQVAIGIGGVSHQNGTYDAGAAYIQLLICLDHWQLDLLPVQQHRIEL